MHATQASGLSYDAVIVGAGHNGLAAGVILAESGWKVLVVERNDGAGGAVRTEEITLPGFKHDLFAANLNLFAGSPFFSDYGDALMKEGLEFAPSSHPFSSVFPDGRFVGVSTDIEQTVAGVAAISSADAKAWLELSERFASNAPHLFSLLGTPLPSLAAIRRLLGGVRALGRKWPLDLTRLVLQSTRDFVEEHFESPEMQSLCAVWGMHLDYPPDVSGGALFPFLETFADAANGMALGRGGAASMIDAQVSLLETMGGELRLGAEVDRIMLRGKRATGVALADGEVITAHRAVVANLTPKVLFDDLLGGAPLDVGFRRRVSAYKHAPGALMVHLAMEDLPPWVSPEARNYAYVHVGPYLDDMSLAYQQASAGLLPERPTLVVGQPTTVDPSRAPDGKHVLWVQVRMVPGEIRGDAAGSIAAREWATAKEVYADRVMDIIEQYAPGTSELVLGRAVLSPDDLQSWNPNLVGGDSLGGSHHLMQHFFLRPFPGWTRYRTPIKRLYMCGAGTWPGAGVGAGSGYLLGKMLTKPGLVDRARGLLQR